MSLINPKNFIAPFTNVVHMITILLVAICFAVLRLNGASLSFQNSNSRKAPVREIAVEEEELLNRAVPMPVEEQKTPITNEDIYDPSTGGAYESPKRPTVNPRKSGLDDIEKSLGIR